MVADPGDAPKPPEPSDPGSSPPAGSPATDPAPAPASPPVAAGPAPHVLFARRVGRALVEALRWRRVRKFLLVSLVVLAGARIALGLFLDSVLDGATRGTLGIECKIGRSSFDSWTGHVVLRNVRLVGRDDTTVAEIGRAELELSWFDLPSLIVHRISIEDANVRLKRDKAGKIPALAKVLEGAGPAPPASPAGSAPTPAGPEPLPIVLLKRLRAHNVRVLWEDEAVSPSFRGEVVIDVRANEVATFEQREPPSVSIRLAAPGILDQFQLELAGHAVETSDVRAFDLVVNAEAHPEALGAYFGEDVRVCAKTILLAGEARGNLRKTFLDGGTAYTGDIAVERLSIKADEDELSLGRLVALVRRMTPELVELSSVAVDRPRFTFGRLRDGATRILGFGLAPRKGPTAEEGAPPPTAAASRKVVVDEVQVNDGRVRFRDETTEKPVELLVKDFGMTLRDLTLDPEGPGRTARLDASVALAGVAERVTLAGTFVPTGSSRQAQLDLVARNVTLAAIAPWLEASGVAPDLNRGTLFATLRADAAFHADGTIGFASELSKVRFTDQDELIGVDALRVERGSFDPAKRTVGLGRITVERPRLNVRRAADGALSVLGLKTIPRRVGLAAPRPEDGVPEPVPPPQDAPLAVSIERVAVRDGALAWRDDALAAGSKPVQLALAQGTLDVVGFAMRGPERKTAQVKASAALGPSLGALRVEAALVPDPAAPEVTASLTISELAFAPLRAYLDANGMDPVLERGKLEVTLSARARVEKGAVHGGRVALGPVSLRAGKEELFALDSIALDQVEVAGRTTSLGEVTVTGLRGRAARDARGALTACGVRVRPRPAATAEPGDLGAAPPPADVRWDRIALRNVAFAWHDEAVLPAADVRLVRLDATLGPDRLDLPTPAPLKLHAEIERTGVVDVTGQLVPSGRAPAFQGDLRVRALTLASIAPYVSASGYSPSLVDGTIEAHLDYKATTTGPRTSTRAELTKVSWRDGAAELFGVDRATFALEQDAVARTLHVTDATIVHPRVIASRTTTGELALLGLLQRRIDPDEPRPAPAVSKGGAARLHVDRIKVEQLEVAWRDLMAGAFVDVRGASVDVGALAPGTKATTPWRVKGDLGPLGALDLSGTAVLATRTTVAGKVALARVRGEGLDGYLGAGTSLRLEDGTIGLAFDWASEPASGGGKQHRASIRDLAIVEKGRLLLGWNALRVIASRVDAAAHAYVVDELALEGLAGEVEKLPGGVSRSFGFRTVPVPVPPAPPPVAAHEPPPLPSVTLSRFSVGLANLLLRDRSAVGPEPAPFVIETCTLESEAPFVLSAEDPTTARLELALRSQIAGVLDAAVFKLRFSPFEAEPHARLSMDLTGIHGPEIARRSPSIAARHDLGKLVDARARGVLTFTLKSHHRIDALSANPAPLAFETSLEELEVRSSPDGPVTLGLDELRLDVASYDRRSGATRIKALELSNPILLLLRDAEGARYLDVLTRAAPVDPQAQPAPSGDPARIRIEKLTLNDGEVSIVDSSVSPELRAKMTTFEVELLGVSADWKHERRPMKVLIRTRTGSIYDDIKFKGVLSFAPRVNGDFEARILGLKLDRVSGYTEQLYKLKLVDGRIDVETRGSFKDGKLRVVARVTLMGPEVEEPPENCTFMQGSPVSLKTGLALLRNEDDEVQLEVPVELEFDENLALTGKQDYGIGAIIGDALGSALRGAFGPLLNAVSSIAGEEKKKKVEEDKTRPPVNFAPADAHLPSDVLERLDQLAEQMKNEPLRYVSLRGEIGQQEEARIRLLACPPPSERRDLIARLEADRARLDRRRADAVAEVRAALQAGTAELGAARARLGEARAQLARLDRSLDALYEQEREGGNRAGEKRARELASELCDRRVEAVFAYLAGKGAPVERLKRRPHRVKGAETVEGRVAIDTWVARRESVSRDAVQKPAGN